MKKVGVLGCTGEIGKRIVELLQKNYSVKAGFHKVNPDKMWSSVEYSQFDIHDRKRLTFFIQECYIVINCAGASFIDGMYVAQICSDTGAIYIDPFGANYLEQEIRKANVPGTFILSCGCFPGFTGLAMKYLCDSYESVNSISGICIDRQIPGVNGIIDFIISGLKGFGETSYYYYAGNKKYDDKQENFRDYDGKEVEIQKYFTTEIADVINKFSPRKAIWYTPALDREITEIMQKAVVGYIQTEQYISIFTYAQKIQKLIEEKSRGECETGCEINIWSSGLSGGKQRERSIVIKSSFGSSLTAAVLDTVTAKIMEKGLTPGIYYATDIISMLDVIKQNVNREINYYCNDESINIGTEGIVYEEGIL